MKLYQPPTIKILRPEPLPIMMMTVSVVYVYPIIDPDDEDGGLVNHFNIWDKEY